MTGRGPRRCCTNFTTFRRQVVYCTHCFGVTVLTNRLHQLESCAPEDPSKSDHTLGVKRMCKPVLTVCKPVQTYENLEGFLHPFAPLTPPPYPPCQVDSEARRAVNAVMPYKLLSGKRTSSHGHQRGSSNDAKTVRW